MRDHRGSSVFGSVTRLTVLAALLVSGCAPAATTTPAPDPAADREQIRAAADRVWAAVAANDADALLAEYDEGAIMLGPGSPMVQGKAAITTAITDLLGAVAFEDVRSDIVDITVSGDLGIETGTYAWTTVPAGGSPATDQGKYVHVWARSPDGAWKAIRYVVNSDLPPQ
jgi:uncharacterized protein (TIGR02246 family)